MGPELRTSLSNIGRLFEVPTKAGTYFCSESELSCLILPGVVNPSPVERVSCMVRHSII